MFIYNCIKIKNYKLTLFKETKINRMYKKYKCKSLNIKNFNTHHRKYISNHYNLKKLI